MNIYKYADENNSTVKIVDSETGRTKIGPVNRFSKELQGKEILPFMTSEEEKTNTRNKANILHDSMEVNFIVEANGRKYNFNPMSVSKFGLKLLSSQPGDIIKWTAFDNVQYDHTITQAKAIFEAGETFLYALHKAKQDDKEACNSEDYSLSNLNSIKTAQESLKEQT